VGLRVELLAALGDQPERRAAFQQRRFVLAGDSAPLAQRVETVVVAVFIDYGGERANFLQLFGRRHRHPEIGGQPTPVEPAVLRDEVHAGCDVVLEPSHHCITVDVLGVGVLQREVMCVHLTIDAICD